MAMGTAGAAGCGNKSEHRDSEKDALNLAIGSVDKKFNPLFYTALNDGTIANMTQVSLITADSKGNYSFGEDVPTVALDYRETYKSGNDVLGTGDGNDHFVPATADFSAATSTEYEFIIKKGMMFSDGKHELTVMDVLFNLYIYLDPVYNGSNTIYSTKIKGLAKYRTQNPNAQDDANLDMSEYYGIAIDSINQLLAWSADGGDHNEENEKAVYALYKEELESVWSSVQTGWRDAYKEEEYRFTEAWEAFYYQTGAVSNQLVAGKYGYVEAKDEEGRYLTSLDPDSNGDVAAQALIDEMAAATTDAKIQEYMSKNEGISYDDAKLVLQGEHAINHVYTSRANKTGISIILSGATYGTALDKFALEALSAENDKHEMSVQRISGITVGKTTKNFAGENLEDGEHDVLKIEINGIDPKAKWNFGFSVTPMYYYSDAEHYNAAMADYNSGKVHAGTATNFGVKFRDIDWFNEVPGDDEKTGLPMGAGAYKCCNSRYNDSNLDRGSFFYNFHAYFQRNDQFTTMGKGVENAKINRVNYRVTRDDKIVESLQTKEIDYGEPTATGANQTTLRRVKGLEQIRFRAGGYGYVGINPRYVPDIEVRRAIMHAFDTSSIVTYYTAGLVDLIDRPMSLTSWAYPDNADRYYKNTDDSGNPYTGTDLRNMITKEGNWQYVDGKLRNAVDNKVLKLTFTIAGESTDHPSYIMFQEAETLLEDAGMDISVVNSVTALQDLATGNLQVWAAAWSSSIDPDPYQIYSKNSNASSTKNWYKDGIVKNENHRFDEELRIANELSDLIDQGRKTLDRDARTAIYHDCLDLIMELAVEFPTYQRNDLCVYNSRVIDVNTIYGDKDNVGLGKASYQMGPLGELWKVNFVK